MWRILVVGTGHVLDDALSLLLREDKRLRVSKFVYTDDTSLLNAVSKVKPDVIVMVENGVVSAMKILDMLRNASPSATLRIVSVHEDNNAMEIYDRTGVTVTDSRDLLHVVRHDKLSARK